MEQRSHEWDAARAKRITASRMGDVLAGANTKRHKNYIRLLQDNLRGVPDFSTIIDKPWFDHGRDWEAEASGYYEFFTGQTVEHIGFVVHPEYDFIGSSPDGLVGNEGQLEIKCHKSDEQYAKVNGLPSQHKPQVQSQLWISGREWCDFVAFWRNMEGSKRDAKIYRIYPDKEYHKKLEAACLAFWEKVNERDNNPIHRESIRAIFC